MRNIFIKTAKWLGIAILSVLGVLAVIYCYLAFQTGTRAIDRPIFTQQNKRVLVFAHRGGGGLLPENTLPAFIYSSSLGADVLELDIHRTSDGELVVIHDRTVDRTTDGRGKVSEMTLAELKELDAAAQFTADGGKTFPFRGRGFTIPTLREIFDAFPDSIFNVEPKRQGSEMAEPLCALIREKNMTNKVIVGSFTQSIIDDTREACPEIATSATPTEAISFFLRELGGIERSYSPPMQALQIPKTFVGMDVVTKDFVDAAHERNLKVHVWTINSKDEMQRLIDLGVDGIMTDYPNELLKLLDRK